MVEGDWARVKKIFAEAIERDEAERLAWVKQECAGDVLTQGQVEGLLRAHEDAGEFLGSAAAVGLDSEECPGAQLGPYRLQRLIGEGGFGRVWEATQEEPIRRIVALKILKPGRDSEDVLRRFEAERQVLADLDHPNVARILDAGQTERGRPYFVMERVDGPSITEYCDARGLSSRDRLGLMLPVCEAVQHAHLRGVVHRDLKPSNILIADVDGRPHPQVIDFGIAKALDAPLGERTDVGPDRPFLGTPGYVSPEQVDPALGRVDARSDVYSLGALLYELLTGVPPLTMTDLDAAAWGEVRKFLLEVDPVRPSTRVVGQDDEMLQRAKRRGGDTAQLSRDLAKELDWVVLKALAREPGRRYESPVDLAADVKRYLENQPVQARPASRVYRLRKAMARRGASAGWVVALILLVGVAGVSLFLMAERARAEKALAIRAESIARMHHDREAALSGFMRNMISSADPTVARDLKVEDILSSASEHLGDRFVKEPAVEIQLREKIAGAMEGMGKWQDALGERRRILEIYEALREESGEGGADGEPLLGAAESLANALQELGNHEEALPYAIRVAEGRLLLDGPPSESARHAVERVAGILEALGRGDGAKAWRTRLSE